MALTPQEQAELDSLQKEAVQMQPQAKQGGLTPQEQQELAQLQNEAVQLSQPQQQTPLEAGTASTLNALYGGYLPQFVGAEKAIIESGKIAFSGDISGAISRFPDEYTKQRDIQAQQLEQAKEQYPYGTMAGEIAGGTGLALLTGGAGLVGEAIPAATALGRVGQAAKAGATYGLLQNPGDVAGEVSPIQAGERIGGAVLGGTLGGVIHGGLEAVGLGGAKKAIANKVEQAMSERPMVQEELVKLKGIARSQNLPEPTIAQATQGKAILAEKNLMDVPFYGKKIRDQADAQVKAVRKNLESEIGDFINNPTHVDTIGSTVRDLAHMNAEVERKMAQKLYSQVEELGTNASIGKRAFFEKYRDFAAGNDLINPDMTKAKYSAQSGLGRDEFNKLQTIVFDGLDAIKESKSPKMQFKALNAMRKSISSEVDANTVIENGIPRVNNLGRILKGFEKDLKKTTESSLNRELPQLGQVFKEANKKWGTAADYQEIISRFAGERTASKDIPGKIMGDPRYIEEIKKVIGKDKTKEMGMSYINSVLSDILPKSGDARASSAISALNKISPAAKAAIGDDSFNKIINNLYYLDKTGQPIVISKESARNLWALAGGIGKMIPAAAEIGTNLQKSGRGFNLPSLPKIPSKYTGTLREITTPQVSGQAGARIGNKAINTSEGQ